MKKHFTSTSKFLSFSSQLFNLFTNKAKSFRVVVSFFISTLSMMLVGGRAWGQNYQTFDGTTTNAWNATKWTSSSTINSCDAGAKTTAFTAGRIAYFCTPNGTGSGSVGITIGGIIATENYTHTSASGTLLTGGAVVTIDVASGKVFNIASPAISTAAGTGFIKAGLGAYQTGSSGNFTGGFTVNAGTMLIAGINAMGSGGALTLNGGTIAGTASRDLSGKYTGITIGGNVQFGEMSTVISGANSTANLTFNNDISLGNFTRTLTLGNGGIITFGGSISNTGSNGLTFTANSNGTGRFDITGTNTFSGPVNINGNGTGVAEVRFTSDASIGNSSNTVTIDGGRFGIISGGAVTIASTRNIAVGATVGTSISVPGATGVLIYNGVIADKSANVGILAKQGAGTLSLGGVSTYTGNTSINNGIIQLTTGNDRLPTTTILSLGQSASTNLGTFDLNGRNQTIAGLATTTGIGTSGTNTVTSSTDATLTISGSTDNVYGTNAAANNGIISGAISIVKSGSGKQTFGGTVPYTYSGTTTINQGTIECGVAGILPNTNITLGGGKLSTGASTGFSQTVGTLSLTGSNSSTIALGTGSHTLTFANSSAFTPWGSSATLIITGWTGTPGASGTAGKIFVGSNSTGLTSEQLAKISFSGFSGSAIILSTGEIVPSAPTPIISGTATATAFTTTYGTASSTQTFSVTGSNLTANLIATAPTGFEVSSDGITYGSTATFTQSGGNASGNLRIRLAANAAVTGSYNSQNIVLSSTGATSVNITTSSSGNIVTAKALTINGITANNKVFDGTTSATLSGTPVLNGVVAGDEPDVTLGGTTTATFAQSAIGNGIAVNVSGYTISGIKAGNYSLTQPSGLTANITQPAPVINSTLSASATYGTVASTYTITATNNPTSFNATGLPAGLSINTTTGEITGTPTSVTGSPFNVTISATNNGGTGTATLLYTINKKELTIINPIANNKVYDRTNVATISGILNGVFGSDDVVLNGTGTFSQVNVGTGLAVTSTSTLTGTDATKYTLTQPTGLTANITTKSLTVSNSIAENKVYDGNTNAVISGATLNGVISPDNVTVSGNGTFASADANAQISVTTSLTLAGTDNTNYSIIQPTGLKADITAKALTITGVSGTNKVYDRTTTASLGGSPVLNGVVGSDDVSLSGTASATFSDKLVGNSKTISVTGYTLAGTKANNYSVTQPTGLTANITPLALTISNPIAQNKVYDRNNNASITGTLTGVISTDDVTLSGTGSFVSSNVGDGISVSSTSTISGADATNYTLTQPTGLTANITQKSLLINGITANDKNYDGTTTATLSGTATATLTGIVIGDESDITLGGTPVSTFAQSAVGNAIAVTVSGFTISGTASGNYSLVQPTGLTANIIAVPAPVINSVLTASATYGTATSTYVITATNNPTSFNATGLPSGLTINTTTGEITGTPTSITGSPFNVTISATNSGGTGTATLVYTINQKVLTIASPIANNKVYDKTNATTISGTLNGVFGSDDVTLNGTGTYSQVNVGTSLAVTSTSTLGGTDATKYTLTQPTGLTANITAKPLTISNPVAQNKVYDGTTNATITGTLTGIISPDVVTLIGTGTFASSAVGNGIAVTSNSTLGGSGASNYSLTQPTGLAANITAPQFSTGNLVVLNVNSTNSVSLLEYSNSGTLQQTFSIPSTGAEALTISYTAGSEGALSRSQSGYYLGLVGYRTGINTNATDRVIARVNNSGTVNTKSVIPNSEGYTGNNIRSAVFSDDGSRFWTSGTGTGGGVRTNLFEATSGSTQVSTSVTNTRAINIFNNQLYVSSASGTFQGLSAVGTGLPTSTGNTVSILPGFPTASGPSSYGFAINPSSTIAYVADDRATASGGIQKWTFTGGTWTLAYTLGTGVTNIGARGLTVDWSGANPVVYATTAEASLNRIIKITDTGASSTSATLATSSANNIFRGIAFSPILAPTSVSLSVSANAGTEAGTTAITVTATTSAAVTSNQTVDLLVSGTGITSGDYTLSNSIITIPSGSTSGSVTFTVVDDMIAEATEIATLTITNPSSGIVLGSPFVQNITITDNDNTPPTISMNVSSTSDYIDGGITTSPASSFATSSVLNDPTNPIQNFGIDFTISDSETPVANLVVTATSSNTTVVPNANINLTGTGASRNLKITPTAVGYSDVTVSVNDGITTTTFTINLASSAASTNVSTTRFHTGTSDASTARMIDNNLMIVGDDENQALRIYNRQNSGLPISSFDFTSSLGLTDVSAGVLREVDIEASAKVGNRIYWLGSHSNAANGNSRPNRYRFFATDVTGTGNATTLTYVGRYDGLKTDLLAWDANNLHGLGANYLGLLASGTTGVIPEIADGSGFNIEGLEIAPDNSTAYICFRAPLETPATRNKALIVPLTNFTNLVTGNPTATTATFGSPILLDLGGRAIREMKRNANGEYLIIAGPNDGSTGVAPKNFRLYTWTGKPSDAPILKSANLTTLNVDGSFESIVDVPNSLGSTSQVQLLVDNGDAVYYGDAIAAKDLSQNNFKKFRSETINLGSSALAISSVSGTSFCDNTNFDVTFTTSETYNSGNVFTLQLSDANGSFNNPTSIGTFTGVNAGTITATIPSGTAYGTGYRVRVVASNTSLIGEDNGTNLAIYSTPSAPVAQNNVQIVSGESITLTATGCTGSNGTYTLKWYQANNDQLVNMPISPTTTTTYYAKCVATNNTTVCSSAKSSDVVVTVSTPIPSTVITSITSGDWETATTWDLGRIPQNGDIVIIDSNHIVTLSGTGLAKNVKYNGTGKLILNTNNSQLKVGQ